jgi:hypothetical protein
MVDNKVGEAIFNTRVVKCLANFSLGGTTGNVTPQKFDTHPTLGQHRTHLRKNFHFKLYIERLFKSCRFETSIGFIKNNFNIPNEWSRKKFQESNTWGMFVCSKTSKEHFFNNFLIF